MMPSHLATFDKELPPGDAAGSVPAWVHLLSSGRATARDGRQFTLANPEAVIDAFLANNIDLPVDYEHQADKAESRLKGPVPAAGWIKSLEMRENGLWGQVEWTATAARMIAAKEYRTISPSIVIDAETKEILRLNGAGLVHHPALELTALAEETAVPENADRDLLSEAVKLLFGFPTDTTSAEVLAAVVKMVAIFRTAAGQQVSKLPSETASLLELSGLASGREEIALAETVATLERQREEAVAELRSERITPRWRRPRSQASSPTECANGRPRFASLTRHPLMPIAQVCQPLPI